MNTTTSSLLAAPSPARPWPGRAGRAVAVLAAVAAALSVPLWFRGDFVLFMATQAGVMMLVAIGLNLLTGYAGQVSLGHGALVAVGSYTTALLMIDAHWSFWLAALAGMAVSTLAGLVMALPALRLSTWYFALVTLTFAQVVTDLLVEWRSLTRGFSGLVGIPPPAVGAHVLNPVEVYLAVAVLRGAGLSWACAT
jgi:branched-chain amino acid transport system permease protein